MVEISSTKARASSDPLKVGYHTVGDTFGHVKRKDTDFLFCKFRHAISIYGVVLVTFVCLFYRVANVLHVGRVGMSMRRFLHVVISPLPWSVMCAWLSIFLMRMRKWCVESHKLRWC